MAADKTKHDLPRAVWALGLTALFMDTSSELIHGLLPVFLVVTLGASAIALGAIEGIAEATAQITRVFSGWLSDALGKRRARAPSAVDQVVVAAAGSLQERINILCR
jgi:nitrate/nitrite transporter NarK